MTEACTFSEAYRGRCGAAADGSGRCERHAGVTCQCGAPATHECSYAGQFVCCRPLCDDCEGWEDSSKSGGSWGFMNHSHRRKGETPAPVAAEPEKPRHLRTITFRADTDKMFDLIHKTGGDFSAVGDRLAACLLGGSDWRELMGLAVYGIEIVEESTNA